METIESYQGEAGTHHFTVTILHDSVASRYVARIITSRPPIAHRYVPGGPDSMISDDVIEDITGGTPEGVIDVAKKVIATRCGRITVFQKGTGHRKSP